MALETCRAFLPVAARILPVSQTIDPDDPVNRAYDAGWSQVGGRDLCPACTRSRRALDLMNLVDDTLAGDLCAHTSTPHMIDGQRRCTDCGAPR
jgi:hypothetical protein